MEPILDGKVHPNAAQRMRSTPRRPGRPETEARPDRPHCPGLGVTIIVD